MQTYEEQIAKFRGHYSKMDEFLHEGVIVRVVAYIMWTGKKTGKEYWVFKLSNRRIIKVNP